MSSRREEKEQRRRERLERERAQLDESRKRRLYSIVAGAILAAGAIVAVVVAISSGGNGGTESALGFSTSAEDAQPPPPQRISNLQQAAKAAGCTLQNPEIEGRTHVTDENVKYNSNPPTSGNHYPIPQEDGVYTKTPPMTHLVHSLEHGRVLIQYKPSIAPKRLAQLGGFYNEDKAYMVLFPNAGMPYTVAVTAWGHLAGCKKVTDETFDVIRAFKQRYLGSAPESLESQPTHF